MTKRRNGMSYNKLSRYPRGRSFRIGVLTPDNLLAAPVSRRTALWAQGAFEPSRSRRHKITAPPGRRNTTARSAQSVGFEC